MNLINSEIKEAFGLIKNKQYNHAESRAMVMLAKEPGNPKVYELIGDIYFNQNLYKKSIWYYLNSCENNFDNTDLMFKLGDNICCLKEYNLAEQWLKIVIERDPLYVEAYLSLATAFQERGSFEEAIMCYEDAINIDPKEVFAYLNLALLYKKNRDFDKAIKVYQKAIINNPNNHFILSNLGNLFYLQKKYDDAILCHEKAVKIKSDSVVANFNFANTLYNANQFEKAKEVYQKTINLDPKFTKASENLGSIHLLNGNFKDGFEKYHSRIYNDPSFRKILDKKKTIWKGEPIAGKKLLVVSEKSYGNIIQFSRYIPSLKQMGCEIIFSCPLEIHHLFENISEIDEIITPEQDFDNFFRWIPIGDLPGILTPDIFKTKPPQPTNIKINENKLQEWETLLGLDEKVKIGLCWQGNPENPRDHLNSVNLSLFQDLLNIPQASFVSLQKGFARKQIEDLGFAEQIIDYDPLVDQGSHKFLDTVAILKYLDLVITTDTSIAHLAGSLGTPTWILLPKVPDWRWFLNTDENIWYENTRLFRQESDAHWQSVFKNVKTELQILVKNISEVRNS